MKVTNIDLSDEEVYTFVSADNLKQEIKISDTQLSLQVPISVKYNYAEIESLYGFGQSFTPRETKAYFEMMKLLTNSTLNELSHRAKEFHLYRSEIKGNFRRALLAINKDIANSNHIVYHFALYTDERKANRADNIRSPRVYFILGTNGFIYPIFFDPFHELNP